MVLNVLDDWLKRDRLFFLWAGRPAAVSHAYLAAGGWLTATTFANLVVQPTGSPAATGRLQFSHRSGEHVAGRMSMGAQPVLLWARNPGRFCALGSSWVPLASWRLHGAFSLIGFIAASCSRLPAWWDPPYNAIAFSGPMRCSERVPDLPAGSSSWFFAPSFGCGGDLPLPAVPAGLPQLDLNRSQ